MNLRPNETVRNPELERQAVEAVRGGLMASFDVHESLGAEGVSSMQQNRFGETALVADVRAEEAVLSALTSVGARIKVFSEEHGQIILNGENESGITLLGVLDGLDGSSVYQKERGVGRYGTMFALFANDNPRYRDYLAAGIMEHSTGRLFLASKGNRLSITDVRTDEVTYPATRDTSEVSEKLVAFVDNGKVEPENRLFGYFDQNEQIFARPLNKIGVQTQRTGSSAAYYAAVAAGEADMVGEATRKGNLEFASAYAVVTAAGGVMQTLEGVDLGAQSFRTFGQEGHVPILTAANAGLAHNLRATLLAHGTDSSSPQFRI